MTFMCLQMSTVFAEWFINIVLDQDLLALLTQTCADIPCGYLQRLISLHFYVFSSTVNFFLTCVSHCNMLFQYSRIVHVAVSKCLLFFDRWQHPHQALSRYVNTDCLVTHFAFFLQALLTSELHDVFQVSYNIFITKSSGYFKL